MVTSQDVENYKQIKSDLDQLRSIVEKSELWVYKRQGSDEGMDAAEGLAPEAEHKQVFYTVQEKTLKAAFAFIKAFPLTRRLLCTFVEQFREPGQAKESRKHQ